MKDSTSKEKKFYTQGQQLAARVLLIAGLLASYSPRNVLAAPDSQLSMAPGASLVEGNLSFQARAGENVRFYYQKGQWRAEVSSHIGDFSRQVVLPVVCSSGEDVASILEVLSRYPSWQRQRQIHVLDRNACPTLEEVVYVGELGLKGGGNELSTPKDSDGEGPDDARDKSPDDGSDKGSDDACDKGPDDAKDKGSDDARDKGSDDARDKGPDDGKDKGPDDGKDKGPDDGKDKGPDDGKDKDPDDDYYPLEDWDLELAL